MANGAATRSPFNGSLVKAFDQTKSRPIKRSTVVGSISGRDLAAKPAAVSKKKQEIAVVASKIERDLDKTKKQNVEKTWIQKIEEGRGERKERRRDYALE